MTKLTDKVIIITGASSGIGKALAQESMKKGMKVVLSARRADVMQALAKEEGWPGDRFLIVPTDVSKEEDCKSLIEQTIARFGTLDILINNAGISMRALFHELQLEVLQKLMEVNFWGTVYCTYHAMPWLLKSKGSVVGVSSIAGYKGLPARTGYSASKFAMHGFLESLRCENLKTGLHVLIACPGFTASNIRKTALAADATAQGESPRDETQMMTAQQVATRILKATAKRKRSLVLTGQGKLTVWLNKLIPATTDKLVYKHIAREPDSPFK